VNARTLIVHCESCRQAMMVEVVPERTSHGALQLNVGRVYRLSKAPASTPKR